VARADLINTAATFLIGLVIPLAGWTADRVGYRRVLLGADLLYAALVVPAFQAIDRGAVGSAAAAISH
jgi:MFS family permease